MRAYIYARFSTLEQGKGSSLARQLEQCRGLADRHGWSRAKDRELIDEGKSAFSGANRAEGSVLASFERDAVAGLLPDDPVLVVERLDRLSRQDAVAVFQLLSSLTDNGVAVATVDGDRLYRKGSFDFSSLIEMIVKAQVAHEESEKKSQRLVAAWKQKRELARAGVSKAYTRRCPQWIYVDDHSGEYRLYPDRAAVVQRIFDLATSGLGKHRIARTLNEDDVPTWGRGDGWRASYIRKILGSRATIGEMQPYRRENGKRIKDGSPIRGFYPAVIDEAKFARVQAEREKRKSFAGRRGNRISNLFSGLTACGDCGGPMTYRNKGREVERYLVCDNALRGNGCDFTTHFNYQFLESAVIDRVLHIALPAEEYDVDDKAREAAAEVASREGDLADLQDQQRRLVRLLARHENEEVERQLGELAADIQRAKADLDRARQNLLLERGAATPRQNVRRIRELLAHMASDADAEAILARGKVQQALRGLISSVVFDQISQQVSVHTVADQFTLDRNGTIVAGGNEIGLARLIELRQKGWVLKKHAKHPALGLRNREHSERSND